MRGAGSGVAGGGAGVWGLPWRWEGGGGEVCVRAGRGRGGAGEGGRGVGPAAAPAGAALFAIDRGTVLVYFTETKRLARWSAGTLDPMEVAIDGEVLWLRAAAGAIDFATRRAAGLSIVRFH